MFRKSVIKFTTLLRVCTDGALSMIGRSAGTVALLERFSDCPLPKYCIIHEEPVGNFFICSML